MSHRNGHDGIYVDWAAAEYDAVFPQPRPDKPGDTGPGADAPVSTLGDDPLFFEDFTTGTIVAINPQNPAIQFDTGISFETAAEGASLVQQLTDQVVPIKVAFPGATMQEILQQAARNIGLVDKGFGDAGAGGPSPGAEADIEQTRARTEQIREQIRQVDDEIALARAQGDEELAQRWVQIRGNLEQAENELAQTIREFEVSTGVERERLALTERGQEIDIAQEAARLGLDRDELVARLGEGNADRLLRFAIAEGDTETANALRRLQAAESSRDRDLALVDLRTADRRARQTQRADLLGQEQGLIQNIGQLAQDPGDRGLLAAILTAGQQTGSAAPLTELLARGGTTVTESSLAPLGGQLSILERLREFQRELQVEDPIFAERMNRILSEAPTEDVALDVAPAQLEVAAPAAAAPVAIPTLDEILGGGGETAAEVPPLETITNLTPEQQAIVDQERERALALLPGASTTDTFTTATGETAPLSSLSELAQAFVASFGATPAPAPVATAPAPAPAPAIDPRLLNPDDQLAGMADGGTIDAGDVAVVGEEGKPEVVVSLPGGGTAVIPIERSLQLGGFLGTDAPMIDQARAFLERLGLIARQGTPFQGSGPISPLSVSAPGTAPERQSLADSITQAESGVPKAGFLRAVSRNFLRGLNEQPLVRTA